MTILTIEALIITAILSTAYVSSRPVEIDPQSISDMSERMVEACDQAGGGWYDCTLKEMERVLK